MVLMYMRDAVTLSAGVFSVSALLEVAPLMGLGRASKH